MKLIIAGSRSITDINEIYQALIKYDFDLDEIKEVVSGTANGVDKLGEQFAKQCNIKIKRFPANWNKYGKGAGYIRNKQMAKYGNVLLSVWDGKSKGSKNMIDEMNSLSKKVYVYGYEKNKTI